MCKIGAINRMFYKAPSSLGEGLSRVKSKLGAVGSDLCNVPGRRCYVHKSKKANIDITTDTIKEIENYGSERATERLTSRLTLGTANPNTMYLVDYSAYDILRIGQPVVSRNVRKVCQMPNFTKLLRNPFDFIKG